MFRISDEEYERLQTMCLRTNFRSFSDMVRTAVQNWVARGGDQIDTHLETRVRDLEHQLAHLSAEVNKLADSRSAAAEA